jgi:hypothetical protein
LAVPPSLPLRRHSTVLISYPPSPGRLSSAAYERRPAPTVLKDSLDQVTHRSGSLGRAQLKRRLIASEHHLGLLEAIFQHPYRCRCWLIQARTMVRKNTIFVIQHSPSYSRCRLSSPSFAFSRKFQSDTSKSKLYDTHSVFNR